MSKKAVILFSGGLDSTTCLALAKSEGFACYTLSFAYNQRHAVELTQAKNIALQMGVAEHRVVTLDVGQFGGSALTDAKLAVPAYQAITDIPITYVPARNLVFLSIAMGYAEVLGASDVFIGVNAVDYSGYPDCRPEFIHAFQNVANLATKAGVEGREICIRTPLMHWSKATIIQKGLALGVDYAQTCSCYQPTDLGEACGNCDSCTLRRIGFSDAGVSDPTLYTPATY